MRNRKVIRNAPGIWSLAFIIANICFWTLAASWGIHVLIVGAMN